MNRVGNSLISRGKKGQTTGILIIAMFVFGAIMMVVAGIVFFTIKPVYDDLSTDLKEDFGTQGDTILDESTSNYGSRADTAFVMVFIGIWMALMIAAWYSVDHPIMTFVLIMVVIGFIVVGAYVSNEWINYVSDPERVDMKAQMPVMDYILSHLVMMTLLMGGTASAIHMFRNMVGGGY